MTRSEILARLTTVARHPATVALCVVGGAVAGHHSPEATRPLGVVGVLYLDLLKLIVLPFILSAIVFNVQKMLRSGHSTRLLQRSVAVFFGLSLVWAAVSVALAVALEPGHDISPEVRASMGRIVGTEAEGSNTTMARYANDEGDAPKSLMDVVFSLVPSNVFAALNNNEPLKVLVFSVLFGVALSKVPRERADSLGSVFDAAYHACQKLTHWISLPAPLVLLCMVAAEVATNGFDAMQAMVDFVTTFWAACLAVVVLSYALMSALTRRSFFAVERSMREPVLIGAVTSNSIASMPSAAAALEDDLGCPPEQSEVLLPLFTMLMRAGTIVYFVCGTFFVAALYQRTLTGPDLITIGLASFLCALASAGMSGLLTISLMAICCAYLGLPFDAAFLLFVAVDPVCSMGRTVGTVIGSCAAVVWACDRPGPATAAKEG